MPDPEKADDLPTIAKRDGVLAMLRSAFGKFDSISTGILGTESHLRWMIPGRLLQAALNSELISQLAKELEDLHGKGRLRPDIDVSSETASSLQELLAALEDPPVDSEKFDALKKIFVAAATGQIPAGARPQLVLSVARTLTSIDFIVLATAFRISRDSPEASNSVHSWESWVERITSSSGVDSRSLVALRSEHLEQMKLVGPRISYDRSGINLGKHFGLSDLGLRICELITIGERELLHRNSDAGSSRFR